MSTLKKLKRIIQGTVVACKAKNYVPIEHPANEGLLRGKVALITGGSGGIGFAITQAFLKSGCQVIIAGTNEQKLDKMLALLGGESKKCVINLSSYAKIVEGVKKAIECYGKIDILVNSAGIHSTTVFNDFLEVGEADYDSIMNVNLKGTYFVTQQVAKYMVRNKIKGHILNISSSTALEPAWSPYRLSKWGVKGMTVGFAQQLQKYGIIVNAIAPGSTATTLLGYQKGDSVWTEDNKNQRYILPGEVADYAVMMVSGLGDMIVGDTLYISGGRGLTDVR